LEKIIHGREEKLAEGKSRVGVGWISEVLSLNLVTKVWLKREVEFIQCLCTDTENVTKRCLLFEYGPLSYR
jgi:hypothetical protein